MLDNFLLVTDWTHNKIYQVALDSGEVRGLDTSITGKPAGIAYNHVTKTVIWGDTTADNIHSVELKGSNAGIISETGITVEAQSFFVLLLSDFAIQNKIGFSTYLWKIIE